MISSSIYVHYRTILMINFYFKSTSKHLKKKKRPGNVVTGTSMSHLYHISQFWKLCDVDKGYRLIDNIYGTIFSQTKFFCCLLLMVFICECCSDHRTMIYKWLLGDVRGKGDNLTLHMYISHNCNKILLILLDIL